MIKIKPSLSILSIAALALCSCSSPEDYFANDSDGSRAYVTFLDSKSKAELATVHIGDSGNSAAFKIACERALTGVKKGYQPDYYTYTNGEAFKFDFSLMKKHIDNNGYDRTVKYGFWSWEYEVYLDVLVTFAPTKYKITYSGIYDIEHDNPETYTIEDQLIVLAPIQTTSAYRFNGWKLGGKSVVTINPRDYARDLTLDADIEFYQFSATYYVDGQLYVKDFFDYFTLRNYRMPEVPKRQGYRGQWDDVVNGYCDYVINAIYTAI